MAYLYITEQGALLKKSGQRLVVLKDGEKLADIPAAKIDGVLIFGNVQFTTQAVQLLFQQNIELALLSSHGKLLGQLASPVTKNIHLRQAQYARKNDNIFVLKFSKAVVFGKLSNALELMREFSHNHPDTDIGKEKDRLAALCDQIDSESDLSYLLGMEGLGSRIYFQAFAKMIRHSFSFQGRRRRPAPDPVNALLSLGYTMVYNEISSLLDGLGFDPYLGFYHRPHYGHATLASDILEEFRSPLVDRLTLKLINNRIFKIEDFFLHNPSGGMYLKQEPRKRYFAEYENFITRPMNSSSNREIETDFRRLFRRQAERLKQATMTDEPYRPYRFAW
ncbi:MAG: CRISPR-associated endonuclease Cas1 [Deltaproteobacteria bacterium]|nr:CRISPR-associated endonuclease Cas1 [Deltaproteobacteria bacterium]MBW2152289.1 CRISPR-associated endonuclease Cas1 [Deltaproteobacteria bacterium]